MPKSLSAAGAAFVAKDKEMDWHYVESPDDFGPDWQLRFGFTPVIKLPWGK